MNIQYFNQLKSTNQYCELLNLNEVEEFTVICALQQSAGIGQKGNVWECEPFQNLAFSLILHPTFLAIPDQYMLTKTISLGIYDWLQSILPNFKVSIKWPNDIYVDNFKICGTLISNKTKGNSYQSAICGIGININQTTFSDWIPNPTSLTLLTQQNYNIKELLPTLLQAIQQRYLQLQQPQQWTSINTEYLSHLLNYGISQSYLYQDKTIQATIVGVNQFGHLQLSSNGEHLSCQMKEIKLLS